MYTVRILHDDDEDFLHDFLDLPQATRRVIFRKFEQLRRNPYQIAIPTNSPNLGEYYIVAGNKAITFEINDALEEVTMLLHYDEDLFQEFLNPPN